MGGFMDEVSMNVPCCLRWYFLPQRRYAEMARLLYQVFPSSRRRSYLFFLAFFWLLGLYSGFLLQLWTDDSFFSLMYRVQRCRVSIVGCAGVLLLPFLFSAFAVYLHQAWLLVPVVYGKALLLACAVLSVHSIYPAGSWLAAPLLLFGSFFGGCVLWVYWLRPSAGHSGAYIAVLALLGSVDYFIISPFLAVL